MNASGRRESPTTYMKLCGDNYELSSERLTDESALDLVATLKEARFWSAVDLRYNRFSDRSATILSELFQVFLSFFVLVTFVCIWFIYLFALIHFHDLVKYL